MKVKSVEFITSAVRREQWPKDGRPCIAFAGRSNVGKSSLINRIVNRKNLVRVSRTPGRTQMLNFFLVNDTYYFVDLPGYGYAKVPVNLRKQWGPMIRDFLENAPELRAVVQLLDIRHNPTNDDVALLDWLESVEMPTILVATKADKLTNNAVAKQIKTIGEELELPKDAFTIFSSEDGRGINELWSRISAALEANPRASSNEP
jgi:GTP-binding protein